MSDLTYIYITGFSLGTFGIISSIVSMWIISKNSVLHNSFGLVCALQSFIEGFYLFIMIFMTFLIFIISPENVNNTSTIIAGTLVSFLHTCATYLQLLKAINRTCAIVFPIKYNTIFKLKNTIYYLLILLGICVTLILFNIFDPLCQVRLNTNYYTYAYASSECTSTFAYIIFVNGRFVLLGVTLFFDFITLFYLLKIRKTIFNGNNNRIMKTKIRFFIHAFISSLFHGIALFAPRIIRPFVTTNFAIYLTASTNVAIYHSFNEFLFVLFTTTASKELQVSSNVVVIAGNRNKSFRTNK